ncbi:MAG TPA: glycogen debranching protein, partial [Thermoplasmatales archaeon]|nr:glycogen debranching protein [Thermoplasmatales archaeon]
VLTIENREYNDLEEVYYSELNRREKIVEKSGLPDECCKLVLAADSFLVKRDARKTVIAGYHWFSDWGRDTLISLPGLTLVNNRYRDAREILECLAEEIKDGLVPNTFDDKHNKPVYNTVDASLWYIDRVFQYLKYTNDLVFLESIWSKLESIIDYYMRGTHHGIHMDDDGLISHNSGLTWMDVCINGEYPTPRAEKAVEIQALWYNALRIMSTLSHLLNKKDRYQSLAEYVKKNFLDQYDQQYDVIDTRDVSCRPNKVFLVSLDFSMVDERLQREIMMDIKENLLTVFGLRTLSPLDSRYKGVYISDRYHRDYAYHNGIVWPWLLGSFIKAFLRVHGYEERWRKYAYKEFLEPMLRVFGGRWDGFIPEIFDGDPPYIPRGCIAQAWSTAEILRSWVEDIMFRRPPYEKVFLDEISV